VLQENTGRTIATTNAIRKARCDVVLLLDGDDVMVNIRVEKVMEAFKTAFDGYPVGMVHHKLLQFSDTGRSSVSFPSYHSDRPPQGFINDSVLRFEPSVITVTSGLAFRKELLDRILPLPESRRATQDWPMVLAASYLAPVGYIDSNLTWYRVHADQTTWDPTVASVKGTTRFLAELEETYLWVSEWAKRNEFTRPNPPVLAPTYIVVRHIFRRLYKKEPVSISRLRILAMLRRRKIRGLVPVLTASAAIWAPDALLRTFISLVYGNSWAKRFVKFFRRNRSSNRSWSAPDFRKHNRENADTSLSSS
jgi:hypothetical protein